MNEWFLIALILASMAFGGSIVFSFMSLKLAAVHWQHAEHWQELLDQLQVLKRGHDLFEEPAEK